MLDYLRKILRQAQNDIIQLRCDPETSSRLLLKINSSTIFHISHLFRIIATDLH